MLKIEIDINLKSLKSVIEKATVEATAEHVKKVIGSLQCSEHKQSPTIRINGSSLENLSFDVSGCCEDLITKAKNKLS